MNQLRHYIQSVVPAAESAEVPDREYLERFARTRDDAAFAALVAWYGGSVCSVCPRLQDREQDDLVKGSCPCFSFFLDIQ